MATNAFRALTKKDKRTVGNLVSTHKYIRDFANGGLYVEDVDNFHLVEGAFNALTGEFEVKYLTDKTKDAQHTFLAAGVEQRFLVQDGIEQFFNGQGERQRIVYLTNGLIFDTSAYTLNSDVSALAAGQKAHYDTATKKFLVHDGTHADYATATIKLEVKSSENDVAYTLGQPMVRFVVIAGV